MPGFELPERELELIAMVAREIAGMHQLVNELYSLSLRLNGQCRRLEDLEKLLQQHTAPKEQQT